MIFARKTKNNVSHPVDFSGQGIKFFDSPDPARSAYLAQLAEIGLVAPKDNGYFLSWPDLYELADDAEHVDSLSLLGLPRGAKPDLHCPAPGR
jgi:hypothetical protein